MRSFAIGSSPTIAGAMTRFTISAITVSRVIAASPWPTIPPSVSTSTKHASSDDFRSTPGSLMWSGTLSGVAATRTIFMGTCLGVLWALDFSPPIGALAQRRIGRRRFGCDLRGVQRNELAAALENAAVDYDRIHVRRLRRGHQHVGGIAEHAEIDLARRDHDEVRTLAGLVRA